jgi:hypothetical protein
MMKSLKKVIFALTVSLLLAGCATSGLKYSEFKPTVSNVNPDDARIYIYRTTVLGAAVQPEVKLNGEVVGRAVPRGFFYVDRKPGGYEITTTTEVERKLSLTLDKGQTRYVRLNISIGFFAGHVYPELIENDVAQKEIQDCRYTGE